MSIANWTTEAFLADATAWVEASCRARDIGPTGERAQPHCRPWSSAIGFETDHGRVWFKVNCAGTAREPALVAMLSRLVPDLVPIVLATDPERAWSLAFDAGPLLRTSVEAVDSWRHWEALLPRYGAAQLSLAPHRDALLTTGIRDVTPSRSPVLLRTMLREAGIAPADVELVQWTELARRVGCLGKALAWQAALSGEDRAVHAEYDFPVRRWLMRLCDE